MATKNDTAGWNNLHHAVVERFTTLIQTLLEQEEGRMANETDARGRTPLHLACSFQEKDPPLLFKFNPEDVDACRMMKESETIIGLLLRYGADPTILDNYEKSPLHHIVDQWLEKLYPVEIFAKILCQFVYGADCINVKDGKGRTILHYVARFPKMKVRTVRKFRSRIEEIKFTVEEEIFWAKILDILLSRGADVTVTDKRGNTPLHFAVAANKFKIGEKLIKRSQNVNIRNNAGQTPLHLAVADNKRFENFAFLLMYNGALASTKDTRGKTPLVIVSDSNDFDCFLKYLVLLIHMELHPKIHLPKKKSKKYVKECKLLDSYFYCKRNLSFILKYHSLPTYTEYDFFLCRINDDDFEVQFPEYGKFLKKRFLEDKNRMEMIDECKVVFSCFGGSIRMRAGRLEYVKHDQWNHLPMDIKYKILSYFNNEELEFLHKNIC